MIHQRMGYQNIAELANKYPRVKQRLDLEDIIRDIGLKLFGFKEIRSKSTDFAQNYNIPSAKPPTSSNNSAGSQATSNTSQGNSSTQSNTSQGNSSTQNNASPGSTTNGSSSANKSSSGQSSNTTAYAIVDQRAVIKTLKNFIPKGSNRQKVVSLRDELKKLKVKDNPIAFCFLLRSMFEISAKIYCSENSIPTAITKNNKTTHKSLKQLLSAVTNKLTSNNSNKGMIKVLHGANTELGKSTGLLSVTSMNQLVHNTTFSIAPHDICTLFNNVYPLLEAMN